GGSDTTVAAIVAGAGHGQDRPLLHERIGGFGDRLAGAQHQLESGRAGRDAELVGPLHFSVGQNFHATSLVQTPLQQASSAPIPYTEQMTAHTMTVCLFRSLRYFAPVGSTHPRCSLKG